MAQSVLFYSAMGPVVLVENESTTEITKATMGLLLQLMGHKVEFASQFTCVTVDDAKFDVGTENYVFPSMDTRLAFTKYPFQFTPLCMHMLEDVSQLPVLFESNDTYQIMVYTIFGAFFTPANVLALTYNPILAKLWRVICRRRLDPRNLLLSVKLSTCVSALTGLDKAQIKHWIEASHNHSHEIRDAILVVSNTSTTGRPCVVLERSGLVDAIDAADLRSLARVPSPGAIQTVQSTLTHLQFLDDVPVEGEVDGVPQYLPLPPRHAAVFRILGTWLPLELTTDFAEILALEYIKLLHRNRHVMTANERTVYDRLYTMHRMRLASTKAIPVIVGEIPNKAKLRPDVKAKCRSCNYDTSASLMVTHDTCAICVEYDAAEARTIQRKHVTPPTQSYEVECSACQCLCAVVQPHLLNIAPSASTGSLTDVCNLCFEEYSLPQLETACGRCPTRVCRSCADHWYGQTKRGRVVLTTHLTCPFCRQWPTANVWQRYNKPVGQLLRKGLLPTMQPQMYYGWCGTCEKV
ncbi:hypothetical protein DYB26_001296 [Aphanomyces astaci]|uniref:RING-type domain-containing protein n=1 Tax=Aphanomyces astaci TaxID=112090 RepID=A0A3R7ATG6_APHAT|nr:hypothetical protein DYB26_001296 [Aphanomyces astaci]